jgi:hypothetical protein
MPRESEARFGVGRGERGERKGIHGLMIGDGTTRKRRKQAIDWASSTH